MKKGGKALIWALAFLGAAIVTAGILLYRSSIKASQSLTTSVQGTQGINNLASQFSNLLSRLGVNP